MSDEKKRDELLLVSTMLAASSFQKQNQIPDDNVIEMAVERAEKLLKAVDQKAANNSEK